MAPVCLLTELLLSAQGRSGGRRNIPVYLSGTVVQEDGTPVTEPLLVEFLCDGTVRRQTYLDPKGNFTIDVGVKQERSWMDAGASGQEENVWGRQTNTPWNSASTVEAAGTAGLGIVNFDGCEIRAHPSADYSSNTIVLSTRSVFDRPEVGTIVLRRASPGSGSTVSLDSLAVPEQAREAFESAQRELAKTQANGKEALKELERAVELYPEFTAAWYLMGLTRVGLNDHNGARKAFLRAIETNGDYLSPYLELARMELSLERWKETCEATEPLLKVNPRHPEGRYFDGMANFALQRYEKAEESFRFLRENGHTEQYSQTPFYLGMVYGQLGKFDAAAGELRYYLENTPEQNMPQDLRALILQQLAIWEQESSTGEP
jgi:Flp pilus assembly protein TadD